MAILISVGALVRVLDTAFSSNTNYQGLNREMVEDHGYLYVVTNHDTERQIYICKSIATGEDQLPWLSGEIEAAEEQADG